MNDMYIKFKLGKIRFYITDMRLRIRQNRDNHSKEARVDMRLLDEFFGPTNWKRSHELINGNLFCTVSIWDNEKKEWVSKQDVGTESNTEKEKGQASDAFKRACFNWGIVICCYLVPVPAFAMLWASYCVFCEFKSVREKSWEKAELRKAEKTMSVIIENKDDIAKMVAEILFNNKESENG